MIPSIDLKDQDTSKPNVVSQTHLAGAQLFVQHGVLIVRNAFDPKYLSRLYDEYVQKYSMHFVPTDSNDPRHVGHLRNMVTLDLSGQFNTPNFYANPKLMPMLKLLLGNRMIMNSLGAVTSMPGSEPQHIHRDYSNIYLTDFNKKIDDSWLRFTPPYAITLGIPLVPIGIDNGSTLYWPGSHIRNIEARDPSIGPGEAYTSDLGTCVLFDYRIIHAGAANRSHNPRPLVYGVYSCDWFRDTANFQYEQAPLSISPKELQKIPADHRALFDWAMIKKKTSPTSDSKKPRPNDLCFCNSGLKYKRCHGKR